MNQSEINATRNRDATSIPLELFSFATTIPRRGQLMLAASFCLVALLVSAAILPIATAPMPPIPSFVPINQTALILIYGLTVWPVLAQYCQTRAPSLLVLGAAGLYTTLIVAAQFVCMPNQIRPGLALGHGAATLTWLWNFWHLAPPLFAIPFAIMEGDGRARQTRPDRVVWSILAAVAAVCAAAGLSILAATSFVDSLPVTADADGGYWALTTSGIGPILVALTALALAVLCWTTRLRSVLQLWLAVSLFLLLVDNVVTDLAAARATIGWFVGRVEATLAGLVVLGVYLSELNGLYRRAETAAHAKESARAAAQIARETLEIALDASGMGEWSLDLATSQSRRSLRHDRIFGYATPQADWSWTRLMQHVLPEDADTARAAFDAALKGGKLEFECRIRRADDSGIRWIAVHGRTYADLAGAPVAMAGCVLDVTDRRRSDERVQEAERMEAIGQLTGGVAHDFNNLLTVILGNLELISRRPGDVGRVERLASSAFAAGRRGTELTEKLLAFSRRQVVKPVTLNLNQLTAEFGPLLKHAAGGAVSIDLDLDPGLHPVRLDASQFQASMLNLAANAGDAMPSGGTLRVQTRNVSVDATQAEALSDIRPGAYLHVKVSDTGVGMDKATAARAFEPFFTTKEIGKGTGLGLSQVYGFARQAGGAARIVSAPGQGCSIEIYLPRSIEADLACAPPGGAGASMRPAINGETVLIVEDEDGVREMAAESLSTLGYGVLTAPDARVALDILRGPSRIDILFSDVVMPGGMNGAQLAVAARTIRPSIKVLLTSGYTATATGGARELPSDVALLRKPYLRDDLAEQLQTVLAG